MTLEEQVASLAESQTKNQEAIGGLTKSLNGLVSNLSKTPAGPTPNQVLGQFGVPNVRTGENPLTSRGFSFMKMMGVLTGAIDPKEAKVEIDVHDRLHQCVAGNTRCSEPYSYAGRQMPGHKAFLAPLATGYLQEDFVPRDFRCEMKSLVNAGIEGADLDEMSWIRRKMIVQQYGTKTLSWLNELAGGALVAPPEMGELIELLRNKEALVNAGARVVPLPPQGRIKYPRQTMASTTYWVGENAPIQNSDIGTGEVILQAKKLAVLIRMPNELVRFASPASEALVRDDMTKSLALGLDLACLEGQGGDNRPLGIIRRQNINTVVSGRANANGDEVVANDIYRMIAAVEESNAECEAFIMRPKTLYKYYQLRSDAVAQGDRQGVFLFNMIREAAEGVANPTLAGKKVITSTQVSQVRSKGTSSALTYILGGMFSDVLIGMFGAIEFAATTLGDTPFTNDQTWVRGILSADTAVRHEAAFVFVDNLDTTI